MTVLRKSVDCLVDIIELLPYTLDIELVNKQQKTKELHLFKSITSIAIQALTAFLKGSLVDFDAQVGENLCQIRAYKNLILARKWLINSASKKKFQQYIDDFKTYHNHVQKTVEDWNILIKNTFHYDKVLDRHEKIHIFFKRKSLNLEIHEDIAYLVVCYALKHFAVCEEKIIVSINYKKISDELMVSRHLAKRIIKKYQMMICEFGCKFLTEISQEITLKNNFAEILPKLYKITDDGRLVLPCLMVTEIIFYHCIQQKIPILIISNNTQNNEKIYFIFNGDGGRNLKLSSLEEQQMNFPFCLTVFGDNTQNIEASGMEYVKEFLRLNPTKIILSNTACHPQYSGKKLEWLRDDPYLELNSIEQNVNEEKEKLIELKTFAKTIGCSKDHQKVFFIRHIYASTIIYELKELYSNAMQKVYNSLSLLREEIFQEE